MPVISFVTLSRSDYASVRPVAQAALKDPNIDVRIIAGGSHLIARYGHTIKQIHADGLPVHATADFLKESDDQPADLAAAYSRAVDNFVRILHAQDPDLVFVLGDRWEMLAVASAASMLQVPIVHHSGGDITQGSADNQTRYALTALSHLHLVALPEHRERLLRIGEEPWRVITTGEPALTTLSAYAACVPDIHTRLDLSHGEPFVLATFHPTSFDLAPMEIQVDTFLKALDKINCAIVLTAPNPDASSEIFFRKYKAYAENRLNVRLFESLGVESYYAAMAQARFMIGNSSSGLWEAPSFKLPVINLGPRQQGRTHGNNVINTTLELNAIASAIAQAESPAFRASLSGLNPYVLADTIPLILECLRRSYTRKQLLAKRFSDPLNLR